MKKSTKKKLKKIFNFYNFAILVCVGLIIASLIVIIEPDFSKIFHRENKMAAQNEEVSEEPKDAKTDDVKVVEADNSGEKITEKEARKLAKKQFKELGEKSIKTDELEVLKIEREGEEYYYISSAENTLEIKINNGEVTRINSVKVEK